MADAPVPRQRTWTRKVEGLPYSCFVLLGQKGIEVENENNEKRDSTRKMKEPWL